MSRVALSKSSLQRETVRLKNFRKYLPSLELKRKQIIAERNKALAVMRDLELAFKAAVSAAAGSMPMLQGREGFLTGILRVKEVRTTQENIVGIRLPVLERVECERQEYSLLATPFWLDAAVSAAERLLYLKWQMRIQTERIELLERALQKTTQRVNLFDKVLIPRTRQNIKKIKIFLSDVERAEVVRAKIAKAKSGGGH